MTLRPLSTAREQWHTTLRPLSTAREQWHTPGPSGNTKSLSNDGPAAVFRLVINVKTVTGADTTGGFGSVYFVATGGAPGAGDIKVADMTFDVEHKYADSGSTVTTGSFYVTN